MCWITENYFLFVGLFDWGNAETQTLRYPGIRTVLHLRNPELENLVPLHP